MSNKRSVAKISTENYAGMRCESPLEVRFWNYMQRTTRFGCQSRETYDVLDWMLRVAQHDTLKGCRSQVEIAGFRVDALIDCDGEKIVVELDGQSFHDPISDEARDRILSDYVDAIIRIPFASMWYYPRATFAVLEKWYPRFKIAPHTQVLSLDAMYGEFSMARENPMYDYSEYKWLDVNDSSFEVWSVSEHMGMACSPKGIFYEYRNTPITRRLCFPIYNTDSMTGIF